MNLPEGSCLALCFQPRSDFPNNEMCHLPEHRQADELLESVPLAKVPSSGQRTDQTLGSAKQLDNLQNTQPLFCVRIFRQKGTHAPQKKDPR